MWNDLLRGDEPTKICEPYWRESTMKFIVKPHPEIFIKSESVRKRFTKILERNIRTILQRRTESVAVFNRRDYIEVTSESDKYFKETLEVLTQTPGIHHSLEVQQSEFKDPKTGLCPKKEVEEWGSKLPF